MNKYTLELKSKIILLYARKTSVKKIASRYHISISTIYRWINNNSKINHVRTYSKEDKSKAIKLLIRNIPIKTVSQIFNISKTTLYTWYKQHRNNQKQLADISVNNLYVLKLRKKIEVLKKIYPLNELSSREKYESIRTLSKKYSITLLCEVFNISKNTYYRHLNKKLSINELRDKFLREEILEIYRVNRKTIGGIKIKKVLNDRGLTVSKRKVYQIMNDLNISKQTKKVNPYLKPRKNTNVKCKNILNQRFNPLEPNLVWVSDVTEIKIKSKPVYLCIIMDLFARKVIGSVISIKNNTRLTELTFKDAIRTRSNKVPVLFHSDRGSNYTSYRFRQLIQKHHITQSFSKPGYPFDNSPMESFFSQFKRETKQERDCLNTIKSYRTLVYEYINYYNEFRFHMGIGLLTPNKKEALYHSYYIKNSKPLK